MTSKSLTFHLLNVRAFWRYSLLRYLVCFLLLVLIACARVVNFQDDSSGRLIRKAYSPNIDLYVFRSPMSGVESWQMGFHVPGVTSIANYLLQFFANGEHSINSLQGQNDMLFYASKIRIFYVTARSTSANAVTATYADRPIIQNNNVLCSTVSGGIEAIPLSRTGLNAANILTENGEMTHYGDLITAGYQVSAVLPPKKLYLTNKAGTNLTGPEIRVEPNHIRIFFSDIISPCEGAAGFANLGDAVLLARKNDRVMAYIAISGQYNNPENLRNKEISFLTNLKITLSHELGHVFGLRHSFASSEKSCKFALMGTTTRIMDYGNDLSQFIPCERDIYRVGANHFLDGEITAYEFSEDGRLLSPPVATRDVRSTALYRDLSTKNQLLAESGRVRIYDADYYSSEAHPSYRQKISREKLSKLEIVR